MPVPPTPAVEVDHVDLAYPARAAHTLRAPRRTRDPRTTRPDAPVLRDVHLTVPAGEHLAVIGRSGCGKSTLLHLIAGLLGPSAGADGTTGSVRVLGDAAPADRLDHCALMPQGDSLLPWSPVRDNVAVPLRNRGVGRREARARATEMLTRCGLGDRGTARPSELSGGMRQRVALARALLADKPVLLADEPLGALDAITRGEIQDWLAELLAGSDATLVMVTHDVDEALLLSHRVVLIGDGTGSGGGDGDAGSTGGTGSTGNTGGRIVADWPGWFARRAGRPREQVLADPEFAAARAEILGVLGRSARTVRTGTDGGTAA